MFTSWSRKIQTYLLFSKIAVVLVIKDVKGYTYNFDHQMPHIAYWHLYCLQNGAILTRIPFSSVVSWQRLSLPTLVSLHYVRQLPFCKHAMFMKMRENDSAHEFIPTKSTTLHLFHQHKIKWMIWFIRNNITSVYKCFRYLNWYIFPIWWRPQPSFVLVIVDTTLKEYEIITLIYNRKTCRLDLLFFYAPKDIIVLAIRLGVWRKNTNLSETISHTLLNTNWSEFMFVDWSTSWFIYWWSTLTNY